MAVTNQPHPEVGALAVMPDRIFYGSKLKKEHLNGKFRIIPSDKRKNVQKVR